MDSTVELNRLDEALVACDEVEQRFGDSKDASIRALTEHALLATANIELKCQRYRAAIETSGRALDQRRMESPENRFRRHSPGSPLFKASEFVAPHDEDSLEGRTLKDVLDGQG